MQNSIEEVINDKFDQIKRESLNQMKRQSAIMIKQQAQATTNRMSKMRKRFSIKKKDFKMMQWAESNTKEETSDDDLEEIKE